MFKSTQATRFHAQSRNVKLLLVSGYPPNTTVGGGIILRNLLSTYDQTSLTVYSNGRVLHELESRSDGGGLLDVRHVGIRPWRSSVRGVRRLLRSLGVLAVCGIAMRLARGASSETPILAVPWGGELGSELFVSAYLAHRLSGAPLVIYEMDEWRASLGKKAGLIARWLERFFHGRMLGAASCIWVVSSQMAEELRARFGVEARVLPNCVELKRYAEMRPRRRGAEDEFRIVYTGAVYGAQVDAIRNVLRAIQSIKEPRVSLVIYGYQCADDLAQQGIEGRGLVVERPVPVEEIPRVLIGADALLLPFSFADTERSVVSTSLPTKLADYLASGVPILVHAPPYSSITRLAQSEGWGIVADEENPAAVVRAIGQLFVDQSLRNRLVARGLEVARLRHDLYKGRADFLASIQEAAKPAGA